MYAAPPETEEEETLASMASEHTYTVLVSVLGANTHGPIFHSSLEGVGKSCLCCRFVYSAVDDYIADHPSLLALHEFESHVVATEPSIYWGKRSLEFQLQGGTCTTKVCCHVVEHTLFYHDETSRPFPGHLKLLHPEDFAKLVARTPESSQKLSYYSRDTIGFPESYSCQNYPSSPQRHPRAFVVAVDVSRGGGDFGTQLSAVEVMVGKLKKYPIVVVATKRDLVNSESLRRLMEWAEKVKLPLVETSAKNNINVVDVFRLAAAKAVQKKEKSKNIPDYILSYADASGRTLTATVRERNTFATYLGRRVKTSQADLSVVDKSEEYKTAAAELGKFATDEIFATHILKVRNEEVSKYAGVSDDVDLKLEFLEEFIEDMCIGDLAVHTPAMKK